MIGLTGFLDLGEGVLGCQEAYRPRRSKHKETILYSYVICQEKSWWVSLRIADHPDDGQTSQYKRVYRYESSERADNFRPARDSGTIGG